MLTVSQGGTPAVVFTFGYDAVGNILSRSETIGGNAAGTNTYVYDDLDRVTRIEQSGTGVTDKRLDLAYNALGQFTAITRYADLAGTQEVATSTYGYDFTHRLTSLTHDLTVSPDVTYTWTYDAASRIVGMTSPDGGNTLTYDDAGQLTGSTLTSESYTYDGTGNRTNSGYSTGDNNRLLSDGTYSYTYDDEGNRTSRTETASGAYVEYAWDHRNRLTAVTERNANGRTTKEVEYTYDMFDRRIAKRVDDNADGTFDRTERYVYDGEDIALVFDGAGSLKSRYLHGPGIDEVFADEDALGEILWALTDNQGTVRDWARSDGTIANYVTYDAFGQITGQSSATHDPLYAYTGREWDADAGMYYYRARWYDPAVGHWLSEDPSGLDSDTNPYRYAYNSPTNFTDPSGLQPPGTDYGGVDVPFPEDNERPRLQPGEAAPPSFQPGGPSDIPRQLRGRYRVSVVVSSEHCWIRYENMDTGAVNTAGRYQNGYGGRYDDEGNELVPPVMVPGIQWDRDLIKEEGFGAGRFTSRSVVVQNPRVYIGDSQFGYNWWSNNCTTYGRDAWYYYSGEYRYLPGPDRPEDFRAFIRALNNPPPPIEYSYPMY